MAQLRRAVKDGHLYILAGQSQGTWQVSEKGEQWLRQNRYPIPDRDEYVDIDAGTFSKLKDQHYVYIHGYEYDHDSKNATFDIEQEFARIARGLPLLLRLKEERGTAWELYLDLSGLDKKVWEELQNHQTDSITASNALPITRRQLIYAHGLLRVYPFPHPYQIFSYNDKSKRLLEQAPETPGLTDNWQGNVFVERTTQTGTWQRRVTGSTVSFSGEVLWLAKADCKLDWPGQAISIGNLTTGWQLWRLTVDETASIEWEAVKNWFKYRAIDVVPQRQRLEIVSIPSALTDDGQYIIEPGKAVWIACYPPHSPAEGIAREISLSAEYIGTDSDLSSHPSKSISAFRSADRVNYFRWSAGQTGAYRIRLQGDASAEPLFVQVGTRPITQPRWLNGLSCTAAFAEQEQALYAFDDTSDVRGEPYIMDRLSPQKLAALTWAYEPEGLPIRASWNFSSLEKMSQHDNFCLIHSSSELTWCWQEKICSALAAGMRAKVTLDAGSFGSIELDVELPGPTETASAMWIDERLTAQFSWLSQMIEEKAGHKRIPLPVTLRETLRQLHEQTTSNTTLRRALEKLAAANTVPGWIAYRLRVLLAAVEKQEPKTHNEY